MYSSEASTCPVGAALRAQPHLKWEICSGCSSNTCHTWSYSYSAHVPNRFILRIETEIGLNRSEATSPMFVNKGVAGGGMGSI